MPRLLLLHHTPTASTRALAEAVLAGAHDPDLSSVEVVVRPALEATADDVLRGRWGTAARTWVLHLGLGALAVVLGLLSGSALSAG